MSRLDKLPRHGNVPIPFFTLIENGKPDFRTHDVGRHYACMWERLCGICGEKLDKPFCFVAGPVTLELHATYMPGMHEECAEAALKLCPWLAHFERPRGELRENRISIAKLSGHALPSKPTELTLVYVRAYEVLEQNHTEYARWAHVVRARRFEYVNGALAERAPAVDEDEDETLLELETE